MVELKKFDASDGAHRSRWAHNVSVEYSESQTEKMNKWLIENLGHDDVFIRDGIWVSSNTREPIEKEVLYFFWGPGYIQFKYEQDMIAFILRFSGD